MEKKDKFYVAGRKGMVGSGILRYLQQNNYENIITIEEHQKSGGFGSEILGAVKEINNLGAIYNLPKIKIIGINNKFISVVGGQEYLKNKSGIIF